jgi:hypothetical protein
MDALLFALDRLVSELAFIYLLKKSDYLLDHLDYLDAAVSLNEIRQSEEYRCISQYIQSMDWKKSL